MVLTTQTDTSYYPPATMEPEYLETEEAIYSNIEEISVELPEGYPEDNYTESNQRVAQLNGTDRKTGPGIVLKVMAGDKFNLRVSSWWKSNDIPEEPMTRRPYLRA